MFSTDEMETPPKYAHCSLLVIFQEQLQIFLNFLLVWKWSESWINANRLTRLTARPPNEKALARGCVAWAAHSTLLAWTKPRRSGPQLNKTWRNVDMPRILGLYPILLADHLPLWISFYPEICYRSRARILSKTPFYSWCVPPCRRC